MSTCCYSFWMMLALLGTIGSARGDESKFARGDRLVADYFHQQTQLLTDAAAAELADWEGWAAHREQHCRQLQEMLGLAPLPQRTPLEAVVTGTLEHDEFTVEKLHFQSRPRLYVTANLYIPKNRSGRMPAVLYLCGHGASKRDGVSYGNKAAYQRHGAWLARNGYVCLMIDTLQLGEIEGIHHGTYRAGLWWWNARGYTPAGVETWNAMRAVDYLISRPEVDPARLGVTGRSGGGAYSWYVAALDERVAAAVPVAGITTLANHVVDGCVEGHCDCMYMINTYRWDFPKVAALAAPRPLLIANTDRDPIFPLKGVVELHQRVDVLYRGAGASEKLGLNIAAGVHQDGQVLQLHALQWFDQWLRKRPRPIATVAENAFEPDQLKVFDELPEDQINTTIHESFVAAAEPAAVPASAAEWASQRNRWLEQLRTQVFGGWPAQDGMGPPSLKQLSRGTADGVRCTAWEFESQEHVPLRLYLLEPADAVRAALTTIALQPCDEAAWEEFTSAMRAGFPKLFGEQAPTPAQADRYRALCEQVVKQHLGLAFVAPRGIGPTAWTPESHTHLRRRFMLLGQTLDGMRAWDVRRAIQAVRALQGASQPPLSIDAEGEMAGIALYAALFEPDVEQLTLRNPSPSHRNGPDLLNVLRLLDVPQAAAMVAERSKLIIETSDLAAWEYPNRVAEQLEWGGQIELIHREQQK